MEGIQERAKKELGEIKLAIKAHTPASLRELGELFIMIADSYADTIADETTEAFRVGADAVKKRAGK